MTHDGWDPEHPEIVRATGVPKKQGGWKGWAFALTFLTGALIGWFLWR